MRKGIPSLSFVSPGRGLTENVHQTIFWERKKAKSLLCFNRFCTSFSEKLRIIL